MKLTAVIKALAEMKIQNYIFQSDVLSPLQFDIAMTSLSHMIRKCTQGYKFTKSQENIYHQRNMNDIKLFEKTLILTIRIYS